MNTEQVKMNHENWTGEESTVTFYHHDSGTVTWEQNGDHFAMALIESTDERDKYGFVSYEVTGSGWDHPLLKVSKLNCDRYFMASSNGITREHEKPYVAASKVLFNTI